MQFVARSGERGVDAADGFVLFQKRHACRFWCIRRNFMYLWQCRNDNLIFAAHHLPNSPCGMDQHRKDACIARNPIGARYHCSFNAAMITARS
jgi:hypothetical protein